MKCEHKLQGLLWIKIENSVTKQIKILHSESVVFNIGKWLDNRISTYVLFSIFIKDSTQGELIGCHGTNGALRWLPTASLAEISLFVESGKESYLNRKVGLVPKENFI
jgi:hypothetical protein